MPLKPLIDRVARLAGIDYLALAALIGLSTWLLIGDFGVRLANTSSDDALVAYAYFFKYPERFAQDAQLFHWAPVALTSMINWLPAVLFKYAGIAPEIFYWLFAFLQNILLGLATFRLTMVMTRSRESAWLSAIFMLAYHPHWWNLGLFADLEWMPYGAWLALPFLLWAGSFALEQRLAAMSVTLLIGGLIHPILGLFAAAMFGMYWLPEAWRERTLRNLYGPFAALALTTALFLLPVLFTKAGMDEAAASQILPLILGNGHAIPWANPDCGYCMPLFVKGLLVIPVIVLLALAAVKHIPAAHPGLRRFLLACLVVAGAATALHVAAYFAGSAGILRAVATRSTILLLAFAVPPAVALAWHLLRNAKPAVHFLAGYVLAIPSPMALLAALLLAPSAARPSRPNRTLPPWLIRACLWTGLALFGVVLLRHLPPLGAWMDAQLIARVMNAELIPRFFGFSSARLHTLLAGIVVYLCLFSIWQRFRSKPQNGDSDHQKTCWKAYALAMPLVAFMLFSTYQGGKAATSGEARDYHDVQAWARAATPVDAGFIVGDTSVYEGWRNFSRRPRISPGGCGFYVCPKSALAEKQRAADFYARHGVAGYAGLDARGLRDFARTFGGSYAVRRKTWAPADLPVAFQNASYVVYDLR